MPIVRKIFCFSTCHFRSNLVALYMVRFEPTKPVEPAHIKPLPRGPYGLALVRALPFNRVTNNVVDPIRAVG